jgi:DNA-binding transcriptional MerR regulator
MGKSPEAFRTISEVAAQLETPAHVLRFWESKFPQIKPVKRAGGRRYYRPDDIALLGGIKVLLHEKGMTIKGVQNLLREHGSRHVATLSALPWEGVEAEEPLDEEAAERVILGPWVGVTADEETDSGDSGQVGVAEASSPAITSHHRAEEFVQGAVAELATLAASIPSAVAAPQGSTLQRLREVLARSDRDRLRAEAGRLAPLVARLMVLRDAAAERRP